MMSHSTAQQSSAQNWELFLAYKARYSHITMAWCAVFIFPAFVLLDYLTLVEWELFLIVRLSGTLAIVSMLLLKDRLNLSANFIAHFACHVVFVSLMWMLSWLKTPDLFFIYAFNTSVGYVISAIFLLWQPRHSGIGMLTTIVSFAIFYLAFSNLSVSQVIIHGYLVLFTVMVMTQFYVRHRYESTYRDFLRQLELNHAYEELKVKNFEINQKNFEVIQQKEKLEELNVLKDKIFMIISHDFRSPLHALKGLIVLLNDSDMINPQEFKILLNGLKYNVDQTYSLLENLLLWSKSQMKGFVVNTERISIHDLVAENTALLLSAAEKKGIVINSDIDEHVFASGDVDMVRLVLRNLISNAIKFTGEGGRISIRSKQQDGFVNISVSDTGIGMDLIQKATAFKPSMNIIGSPDDKGSGLGLMICKEFIEKNSGKIWIESEPGKGSTFTISLPAADIATVVLPNASLRFSR